MVKCVFYLYRKNINLKNKKILFPVPKFAFLPSWTKQFSQYYKEKLVYFKLQKSM